jgi:hypothetical protein
LAAPGRDVNRPTSIGWGEEEFVDAVARLSTAAPRSGMMGMWKQDVAGCGERIPGESE